MTENSSFSISNILTLSKVDSSIARNVADSRKLELELDKKTTELKELSFKLTQSEHNFKSLKQKYTKEEKLLQEEQDKLVNRRKALSTLGSSKAMQAGTREIEAAQKQLSMREEHLIESMIEVDDAEKEFNQIEEQISALNEEVLSLKKDIDAQLATYAERIKEKEKERAGLVSDVEPDILNKYGVIHQKYPIDPVVPIQDKLCGGCYVKLTPQIYVRISRGEFVQCPGCARILYLTEEAQPSA